jgi:hypothetical protein
MNWKRSISSVRKSPLFSVLVYAAFLYVVFSPGHSKHFLHPTFGEFIPNVIESFALSFSIVGVRELNRLGYRELGGTLVLWIVPISAALLFALIVLGGYSENWLCGVIAIFAVPFPVALYLNRKRNKSTPQATIANAR